MEGVERHAEKFTSEEHTDLSRLKTNKKITLLKNSEMWGKTDLPS